MYKLVHTHTKSYLSQNNHALSWAIYTIQVSPQCQACSKSRDVIVGLNLFNQVLALFRTKFTCNLAIRYPVFRWDLCKGSMWVSVKKTQDVCNSKESRD